MDYIRKLTSALLILAMVLSMLGTGMLSPTAHAADDLTISVTGQHTNPLYEDVTTGSVVLPPVLFSAAPAADAVYLTSLEEMGAVLRDAMEARDDAPVIYFTSQRVIDDEDKLVSFVVDELLPIAFAHTGVSTEGDYLKWQYQNMGFGLSGKYRDDAYQYTLTFSITYYTTAEQEQTVTTEINKLLNELDVDDASDYRKLCAIYDYICANVTYDHDNLEDDSYTLKYTAYAALMDGTAVCQGYALLLYRLALELGVDARLIAGDGGGPHGWNIARINDLYYNLDSTWDAGATRYDYFLVCPNNFRDHIRYEEYDTAEFHQAYPMDSKDFDPSNDVCNHKYSSAITEEATCTETGVATYTCSRCGDSYTQTVAALGHEEVTDAGHDATCTEDGLTDGSHCSRCDIVLTEQETIPALGHEEVTDEGFAATCTETGLTEGSHCSRCEIVLTEQEVISALGHNWDEGTVTRQPTETEKGEKTFTCSTCGETRTEEIPCLEAETTLVRIFGENRCETAIETAAALKKALNVDRFDAIILASGENFADALAGSYLANAKGAPILLHFGNSTKINLEFIRSNLSEDGVVYILGGTASIPAAVETALTEAGLKVTRIMGASRFDTNLAILNTAGITDEEILVATGWNFADSLSVSATGLPILMVNSNDNKLTKEQVEFLSKHAKNKVTIIGGFGSVSEELETAIAEIVEGNIERICGENRVATSVAVAEKYFRAPGAAFIAYSLNFPDGLCGGPLACAMGAPLLLINEGKEHLAAAYVDDHGIRSGYVLGGTSVISDASAEAVFG